MAWAETEFGKADLGDPRGIKRALEIAVARTLPPNLSLPQCFKRETALDTIKEGLGVIFIPAYQPVKIPSSLPS